MKRSELRQEVKDLGHNYQTTGWDQRIDRFLNLGAKDIILGDPWPHRRVLVPAVVPGVVIARLGAIRQVTRTSDGGVLDPATLDELRDIYGAILPTGGPALYYYSVANTSVQVVPASAGQTIDVDHLERACWTDAAGANRTVEADDDNDVLLGGDIFEEAVLLATRIRVLEDTDEADLRDRLRERLRGTDGNGGLMAFLRDQHLLIDSDEPQRIKQTIDWA